LQRYDVIVVGGGPSGATAARHCSLKSLATLLLEKKKLPRYKPCAGGVTAAAYKELGFELPPDVVERECSGVKVQVKDFYKNVTADRAVFYTVNRSRFDEFLVGEAAKAGVIAHDTEEVVGLKRERTGVIVRTDKAKYLADLVVGADGYFSTVRKELHRKFARDEVMFCVLCEVQLDEEEIDRRYGDLLLVQYGFIDKGYAWIFPKRDCVSAGVGGVFYGSKQLPAKLREFLRLNSLEDSVEIRGGFVPVTKFRYPAYDERVMLTGDAAGFVDSFTGEGIRSAILSGKIAAETASFCHEQGTFSSQAVSIYQTRCEKLFFENLRYASKITELFLRFPDFLMDTVVRNSNIMDGYLKTMTGEMDYKTFSGWVKRRLPGLLLKRIFS
jgi:geranylgeranyl reductase family protein